MIAINIDGLVNLSNNYTFGYSKVSVLDLVDIFRDEGILYWSSKNEDGTRLKDNPLKVIDGESRGVKSIEVKSDDEMKQVIELLEKNRK